MTSESRVRLSLEGALSVREVKSTKLRLEEALAGFKVIEIDASNLTGVDTTTVQLLISASRTAKNLGKELMISGRSKAFHEFLTQLGFVVPGGDDEFTFNQKHSEKDAA